MSGPTLSHQKSSQPAHRDGSESSVKMCCDRTKLTIAREARRPWHGTVGSGPSVSDNVERFIERQDPMELRRHCHEIGESPGSDHLAELPFEAL